MLGIKESEFGNERIDRPNPKICFRLSGALSLPLAMKTTAEGKYSSRCRTDPSASGDQGERARAHPTGDEFLLREPAEGLK